MGAYLTRSGGMTLRAFLALVIAAMCSLFVPRRDEPEVRFFWVGEESEVFAARDLDTLNFHLGRGPSDSPFNDELLTAHNEGREWGVVGPDEIDLWYRDEDESDTVELTHREAFEQFCRVCFERDGWVQMATSYN